MVTFLEFPWPGQDRIIQPLRLIRGPICPSHPLKGFAWTLPVIAPLSPTSQYFFSMSTQACCNLPCLTPLCLPARLTNSLLFLSAKFPQALSSLSTLSRPSALNPCQSNFYPSYSTEIILSMMTILLCPGLSSPNS